jgi:hypothetical protein
MPSPLEHDSTPTPRRLVTRRRAVVGAAWTVPAITVATAAPAFAYSAGSTLAVAGFTAVRSSFSTAPSDYFWWSGTTYTEKMTAPTTAPAANSQLTVSVTGITVTGAGSGVVSVVVTLPSNDGAALGLQVPASHVAGTIAAGWSLSGTPTFNAVTTETTISFVSASQSTPGALPPLSFVVIGVDRGLNAGQAFYTWNTGRAASLVATATGVATPATKSTTTT